MTAEHTDPFEPPLPGKNDFGRLYTHLAIEPGWTCRLCPTLLAATANGGVACLNCDTTMMGNADA